MSLGVALQKHPRVFTSLMTPRVLSLEDRSGRPLSNEITAVHQIHLAFR